MKLYVLTRGRELRQKTLTEFSPALLRDTYLIAHPDDGEHRIPDGATVVRLPKGLKYLGHVRQWVVDHHDVKKHGPHIVLLDDDFVFAVRRLDTPTHFRKATPKDVDRLFKKIDKLLGKYAEVGVVMRQHQHMKPELTLLENTRINGVLGFNVDVLRKKKIRFDRLPVMTDFDACLQLLRAGCGNAQVLDYSYGQVGPQSNAPGGCSVYRTLDLHREGALGLKKLHPEFVKLVEKETVLSWGGQKRTDVVISWRGAAKAGGLI
jgi:TET-Associated Glycosyltransferase